MSWYVYILRCADESLYTGVTVDLKRRVQEHNHDNIKSAKYTRARRPVQLVYQEPCKDRASACQREYQLRKLPRRDKLLLSGLSGK